MLQITFNIKTVVCTVEHCIIKAQTLHKEQISKLIQLNTYG
jgi:hypothetical protein